MTRPEIVGDGYHFIWHNSEMCLVLEKAPPGQEEKELKLIKVQYHYYEGIEEAVDEDIDWLQKWKDAVADNDTEDSYQDWKDDNWSDIVSEYSADYEPSWEMPGYSLYKWLKENWDSKDEVYYQAQLEVNDRYIISSYEELMKALDEDGVDAEDLDGELLLEINLYFNNTTYRFVP